MEPARRIALYTAFLESLESHPEGSILRQDLARLREHRGLCEPIVRAARLATGLRSRVSTAIDLLRRQNFSLEELHEAGIMHLGKPSLRWTEDKDAPHGKIIIPYLSPDGEKVLYLRAHKMGPSDVPVEVYGQHTLSPDSKTIVLTEGEYKTLALAQLGIPSLGIPGISSFAGRHFRRLVDVLHAHRVDEVLVLFDNEIKNDSTLPGYKPDPLKRWDTEYYACRMATQLFQRSRFKARVARLPDEWRVDGKIDPDQALAMGKTAESFRAFLERAQIPQFYIKRLPDEARVVVSSKLRRDELYRSPLIEKKGEYHWVTEWQDDKPSRTRSISNFVLHPSRRVQLQNKHVLRIATATNNAEESKDVEITPAMLSTVDSFRSAMLEHGNYHFRGERHQFFELAQRLDTLNTPRIAKESEYYGRQKDGSWIFADGVMFEDSQETHPIAEDGIAWSDGLEGTMPPLNEDGEDPMPAMLRGQPWSHDMCEIFRLMNGNVGNPGVALAVGWTLACVFSDEIYAETMTFPILALFGKKGSGKTVLGRFLTKAWGLPSHAKNPIGLKLASISGMVQTIAFYGSMPVWFDEMRQDTETKKMDLIRSWFDRSSRVINGEKKSRTKGEPVRGCLMLSGEDCLRDPALMSRLVIVRLNEETRDSTKIKDMVEGANRLKSVVQWAIQNKSSVMPHVGQWIQFMDSTLQSFGAPEARVSRSYAIPAGTFFAFCFGETPPESVIQGDVPGLDVLSAVSAWLSDEMQKSKSDSEEIDHVVRFFERVLVLLTKFMGGQSIINRQHLKLSRNKEELHFWYTGIYPEVAQFEKRTTGEAAFSKEAIRDYFNDYSYLNTEQRSRKLPVGSDTREKVSRGCYTVDLMHPSLPEPLRAIAETVSIANWDLQPKASLYEDEPTDEN